MHRCDCGKSDLCDCYFLLDTDWDDYEGSVMQQMNDEDWEDYIANLMRRDEDV